MLEFRALPSIREKIEDFLFMQDNASIHTSFKGKRSAIDLFDEEGIEVIDWPARSPDLNPIENVWSMLDRLKNEEIDKRIKNESLGKPVPKNKVQMFKLLKECWKKLDNEWITCTDAITRCYVCKSRGPLGDCKDPFYYNSTSIKLMNDVEERPCPSGWCAKSVELKESDSILSTERFCLQRPPSDNEERCSETMLGEHGRSHVFMCFCRGDFCNKSTSLKSTLLIILFPVLLIYVLLFI